LDGKGISTIYENGCEKMKQRFIQNGKYIKMEGVQNRATLYNACQSYCV
jgi:hypothetical protein